MDTFHVRYVRDQSSTSMGSDRRVSRRPVRSPAVILKDQPFRLPVLLGDSRRCRPPWPSTSVGTEDPEPS